MIDKEEQMEGLQDSLATARATANVQAEAAALYAIGRFYAKEKIFEAADDYLAQCAKLCHQEGLLEEGQVLLELGDLAKARQEWAAAVGRYQQAAEVFDRLGLPQGQAKVLERLGHLYVARGDSHTALTQFRAALDLCRHHGDHIGRLYFLEQMIPVVKELGLWPETDRLYREFVTVAEKIGDRERMALGLVGLANICQRTDRAAEAEPYLALAHDTYLKVGKVREAELVRREIARIKEDPIV